jgi:hypothetical protein
MPKRRITAIWQLMEPPPSNRSNGGDVCDHPEVFRIMFLRRRAEIESL